MGGFLHKVVVDVSARVMGSLYKFRQGVCWLGQQPLMIQGHLVFPACATPILLTIVICATPSPPTIREWSLLTRDVVQRLFVCNLSSSFIPLLAVF